MDKKEKLHPSLEEQIRQAEQIRNEQNDFDETSDSNADNGRCIER